MLIFHSVYVTRWREYYFRESIIPAKILLMVTINKQFVTINKQFQTSLQKIQTILA